MSHTQWFICSFKAWAKVVCLSKHFSHHIHVRVQKVTQLLTVVLRIVNETWSDLWCRKKKYLWFQFACWVQIMWSLRVTLRTSACSKQLIVRVFSSVCKNLGLFTIKPRLNFIFGLLPTCTTSAPLGHTPVYISKCCLSNDHEAPDTVRWGGGGLPVCVMDTNNFHLYNLILQTWLWSSEAAGRKLHGCEVIMKLLHNTSAVCG